MTAFEPILHHHDPSPFAEKIRKAFGIKGISWQSVQIPMVMPKPDLTALTGGYRGTPVMQIGADVYCDTRCIIAEIERRAPSPSLFKAGPLINFGLQHWSDDAVFPPGAALSMHENAEHLPAEILRDREDYFHDLDFARFAQDAAHFRNQFRAHAELVNRQLSDGRAFLAGETPQWIDLGAWMNDFMARGNIPSSERLFADLKHLLGWRGRMEKYGCGERTDVAAEDALDIARDAAYEPQNNDSWREESTVQKSANVIVTPIDHPGTKIEGVLSFASAERITILRKSDRLGETAVHFPRIGYRIKEADPQ